MAMITRSFKIRTVSVRFFGENDEPMTEEIEVRTNRNDENGVKRAIKEAVTEKLGAEVAECFRASIVAVRMETLGIPEEEFVKFAVPVERPQSQQKHE